MRDTQPGEIWKNWELSKGKYSVSSFGRFYNHYSEKFVAKSMSPRNEYFEYSYNIPGGKKSGFNAARIVLMVFKPFENEDPNDPFEADHIDYNGFNDNVNNLRWLPRSENIKRRITKCPSFGEYKKLLYRLGDDVVKTMLEELNK